MMCVPRSQLVGFVQDVALAQQPSRHSWSCIVFVTRKLAALAVDAVLRAAPGLGFLTAAPFMGYGGDTSAVSMDVKVSFRDGLYSSTAEVLRTRILTSRGHLRQQHLDSREWTSPRSCSLLNTA